VRVCYTLHYIFVIAAASITRQITCASALLFSLRILNKSRETAPPRGRIKRDCAGTLYYKEDAWREGFPALTSSLAIQLVRACNVRACLHA